MSKRPYYKRFPSDWLAGVAGLSAEERGVYDTILDLLYDRGRRLVDDAKELARITGCPSVRRYKAVRDRLVALGKITLKEGLISNDRWEKQAPEEDKEAEILGQNGAKSRKEIKKNTPQKEPELFETNDLAKKGIEPYQSPESIEKKERVEPRARRRAPRSLMPDHWDPGAREIAYAESQGFDLDRVNVESTKFRRHHQSRGTMIANFYATWQTWIDNAVRFDAERRAPKARGAPSMMDLAFGGITGGNDR